MQKPIDLSILNALLIDIHVDTFQSKGNTNICNKHPLTKGIFVMHQGKTTWDNDIPVIAGTGMHLNDVSRVHYLANGTHALCSDC